MTKILLMHSKRYLINVIKKDEMKRMKLLIQIIQIRNNQEIDENNLNLYPLLW